jgi:hypothetical protein
MALQSKTKNQIIAACQEYDKQHKILRQKGLTIKSIVAKRAERLLKTKNLIGLLELSNLLFDNGAEHSTELFYIYQAIGELNAEKEKRKKKK